MASSWALRPNCELLQAAGLWHCGGLFITFLCNESGVMQVTHSLKWVMITLVPHLSGTRDTSLMDMSAGILSKSSLKLWHRSFLGTKAECYIMLILCRMKNNWKYVTYLYGTDTYVTYLEYITYYMEYIHFHCSLRYKTTLWMNGLTYTQCLMSTTVIW